MKTLHTIEYTQDGVTIRMTQRWSESYKGGHYDYAIMKDGHILNTARTSGGAPRNKIDTQDAKHYLREWLQYCDEEDRELYGLKVV